MAESAKGKKVVRSQRSSSSKSTTSSEPTWTPTPEAKKKATGLRVWAFVLWLLALGGEAFTIFWVLKQDPVNMAILIGAIVVIGILAIVGSLLWKRANRADPARRSEPFRFWVQNQLGAIITILAFLPLIVMILLNKDMDKNQKTIATAVAAVVAVVAVLFGVSWNSPSVEQYTAETQRVVDLTGDDLVYWTKEGEVYHLCEDASAVNLESADNQIYEGTVGDAHADGKDGITLQLETELEQCGFEVPANIDEIEDEVRAERGAA